MQCKKCGQENMDGAQLCQRCGTTLKKTAVQHGLPNQSVASRIPGVFVLVAGVLVLVGIFLPWFKFMNVDFGEPFGKISLSSSGWDMVTGGGGSQGGAKTYAILTLVGSIVLLVGAVWALATPLMRFAWAVATVGGILAMVGSAWGWYDFNKYVAAYPNAPGGPSYGAGLYLAMLGGIVGLIVGMYAFRRSSGPRI